MGNSDVAFPLGSRGAREQEKIQIELPRPIAFVWHAPQLPLDAFELANERDRRCERGLQRRDGVEKGRLVRYVHRLAAPKPAHADDPPEPAELVQRALQGLSCGPEVRAEADVGGALSNAAAHRVGHAHDVDHRNEVVHAHDVRAAEDRGRGRRRAREEALVDRAPGDGAEMAFSRRSREHRRNLTDFTETAQ